MVNVNMKPLLAKLNDTATAVLHNAAGLTVSRTHYEVSWEHFLMKALEDKTGDVAAILAFFGADAGRLTKALADSLEDFKTGNSGKPVFSPLLIECVEDAWVMASVELGDTRVRTGALLLAFLARPNFFASGSYSDLFSSVNRETLLKDFWNITKASTEGAAAPGGERAAGPGAGAGGDGAAQGFIARFCQDFTAKARAGGIDPVFGRDAEIRQIVDILARRRKNNPILLGDPGVGKTAVIEGLALRIVEGDVPESLAQVTLLNLDMGLLEAGAGMKGEFENRLRGVITEIKASATPIIMFIDEAHTLIGAGGTAGGSDAANLLKPALARGELKTCAATTWSEYKKYFEKDPALARRFQPVKLEEPSAATATLILRGLRASYEKSHKVVIRDDAIQAAAEFADRYIAGRFLPDKAIDLLDTSCARVKVNLSAKPPALEDAQRAVQALERERAALTRDRDNGVAIDLERLAKVEADKASFEQKAADIEAAWGREKEAVGKVLDLRAQIADAAGDEAKVAELTAARDAADAELAAIQGENPMIRIEVSPDLVAQVVSDWTGIPMGRVARDQARTVLDLKDRLAVRIKGQDPALAAVVEVIKAAKSGIKDPNQPQGVFLLVGPSGVGKTETALALADILFGDERSVVSVNMSEFQEKHTVSRLIGSPPGYVGYGEGGMLTEAVRRQPYSAVLLDEVEKAHPDVLNLFYQVFDKGVLTDGEGKEINFKNTLIILTSNLGTEVIQEMTKDGAEVPAEAVLSAVRPLLSQHFKPALLARMTVVPYFSLGPEAMGRIVDLKLDRLAERLLSNNKMALEYAPAVAAQIAARCTENETGARNIDAILNGNVLPRMSQEILARMSEGGMPKKARLDVAEDGSISMDFEA